MYISTRGTSLSLSESCPQLGLLFHKWICLCKYSIYILRGQHLTSDTGRNSCYECLINTTWYSTHWTLRKRCLCVVHNFKGISIHDPTPSLCRGDKPVQCAYPKRHHHSSCLLMTLPPPRWPALSTQSEFVPLALRR